ncbi:MAG: proline--tRNA ligase [Fibrobacterota bacterium]
MKMSRCFVPTLRESPAEAEIDSHKLMLRAGLIRKVAAGIYNYLPLGLKIVRKVERIVREEMDRAGAQEVLMPSAVPAELWKESGRWDLYGSLLLRFKDRKEAEYCFGPTHEEVITHMVRMDVHSYRELPLNLYQIQTKFRDEIRPRFGLMRGREFIMKDAYSFHDNAESLDAEYRNMRETYCRIFERCGLAFRIVRADVGDIGGSASEEFMVLASSGEDEILSCACGYASNSEAAEALPAPFSIAAATESMKEISTPGQKTIEEVSAFLKTRPEQAIKTLIYKADNAPVVVLLRGDHAVNEIKLKRALGCATLEMADDALVKRVTGAETGFAGPVGLKEKVRVVADRSVPAIVNGVTGANRTDYHLVNVSYGRDFTAPEIMDLRLVARGDDCPACKQHKIEFLRGIEVGHIFKLGTKYSESMNARFLDKDGQQRPFIMGCYGIGIGRTAAAAIEQSHDDNGIVWPLALAPFHAVVTAAKTDDPAQSAAADKIYRAMLDAGLDPLLDDRNERLGVRLKDADLIGIPCKIVAGKALVEGKVELKSRKGDVNELVPLEQVVAVLKEKVLQ